MENFAELPKLPLKEQKEQQLLFEIIEKMLQKKHRQALRDFNKKNKQFTAWAKANHYSISQAKKSFTKYLFVTGFSTVIVGSSMLGNGLAPSTASAQTTNASHIASASAPPSTSPQSTINLYDQLNGQIKTYQSWPSAQGEVDISNSVSQLTGIPSVATLDGYKMNKLIGYFGKEQHLYRYPGDTLENHFHTDQERAQFMSSGIAPGLGAWGYFASSKTQFTKQDEMREKYYIAAQTFLFPGYYSDKKFKDWLKFRKVIVYNPANGHAVVAVISDSGPATWTGKSFGGSPELMDSLQMVDGSGKSQAVVLFVNDPNNQIPLGPVQMQPKGVI